ncbi:MAG TPA: ABC transporter ATP-binding protein [Cyclobacteriaceae bacterium]|jgi:lipoprotein-releasing system ATP-binding protein
MLRATDIHKSYGKLTVLKGINIHVRPAEIVAIVGSSGAGKSTLLHILGTLDAPDRGNVFVLGKDVFEEGPRAIASFRNQSIGFVFQFHNLLPEFSALENVMIPGIIGGRRDVEVRSRANELLTMLGIGERWDHKPSELSGGEQQRTAVARALINSPKLLLADEPSGNLDSKNALELHQLFFTLRDKMGQTFVIATHNEELAQMADRRLEIKDGMIQ